MIDIQATATELLATAETLDVMSGLNISQEARESWAQKRDFLRGLADVLDNLPEGSELTQQTIQTAAAKAVA